jgi:hypothetical protein
MPISDEILCQQPPSLRPSGVLEDPDGEDTCAADYLHNTFHLLREEMRTELQTALGMNKGRQRALTIVGILNQQRQRLNIPHINAPLPSGTLPMVSSNNSTPLPPRTRLKSSATGESQPPKQPSQNRTSSNNPPPDLPSLSGLSTASGSQPRKSNASSIKSRAKVPQPASSSTSSTANATLPSTPRHLGKLKGSQRSSTLSPSFNNSTRPSHSQDDNVRPTPNQQGKMKQSPAQSTPRPQPRNVRRDAGLINAVWRELQVNKSTALEAERLAILETERRDADLNRAAARLRDVEAEARSLSEKQARLGDEAEKEALSRQQEATRTREQEAHADMERAAAALRQICEGRAKKKSEEERIQQKLRNLSVCGQDYLWIKQSSGYRCAGGSHFVSGSELF